MMNEQKNDKNDLVWDEQICDYRKPKNFHREWKNDGCITCPSCNEVLLREEDEQLVYCDNCGYYF